MEDVGLRKIIQPVGSTDCNGGWEFAIAETVKEEKRRNVAAHGLRSEARKRAEESIHVAKSRDPLRVKAQRVDALQEVLV
jgi:hypothetical protein